MWQWKQISHHSLAKVDWQTNIIIDPFLISSRETTLCTRNWKKAMNDKFFSFASTLGRCNKGQGQPNFEQGQSTKYSTVPNGSPDLDHISEGIELLSFLYPNTLFRREHECPYHLSRQWHILNIYHFTI